MTTDDSVRPKPATRAMKSSAAMSHSEALCRLTVGDTRSDMIKWVLRRAIDKAEREWKYDASRDMIDASPCATWLVSPVTLLLAAALIGGVGLAAPAAAQVSDQPPAVTVYGPTPERIAAAVGAVVGLIGAVIGGLALARSARRIGTGNGRRGAIVALVMGPIGLVIGG